MTTATKKTKRETAKEANRRRGLAIQDAYIARIELQDPDDPLTHDPMWNPRHPDYVDVSVPGRVAEVSGSILDFETSAVEVVRDRDGFVGNRASAKQVGYLSSLLDRTRLVDHPSIRDLIEAVKNGTPISSSDASAAIDAMKNEPRPNKYAGPCGICGTHIDAGDGGIHKINGRWEVRHLTKPECEAAREAAAATPVVEEPVAAGLDLRSLYSGRYADPDGDGRLKLRIDVVEKGRWDGYIFVKDAAVYGQGNRYGRQAPGETYRGDVEDVLAKIVADPKAAQAAYGKLTGKCGACDRTLEDETSVELGIGPVCRTKGLWT